MEEVELVYYLIIFFLLLYIYGLGLSQRFQVALSCAVLAVFAGFRFNAGYDYPAYYHFMQQGNYDWFEPFSWLLMQLGQHSDPIIFFLLSSLLVIGFYYAAFDSYCRKQGWNPIGVFAYLCLPIAYLDSFGVIRQFVSISIFVYVVSDIERNRLLSIGWLLVAVMFHGAVAVFLPLLLLVRWLSRPRPLALYLFLWVFFLVVGPLLIKFVSLKAGIYADYFDVHVTSSGKKIYLLLSVIFIYFLLNRRLLFLNSSHTYILNCYFIGMLLFSAALPFGIHVSRAGWGVLAVHPLLFGVILGRKGFAERAVFICACFFIMYMVLFFSYKNPERDFLNQYQFSPMVDGFQRDLIIRKSLQNELNGFD